MKLNTDTCVKTTIENKNLGLDEFRFLIKISANSGIGEETSSARNIIQGRADCATQEDSLSDMDGIIFDTLDKLFAKDTTICPSTIDILVINVSTFSPAPSLTSRIVNHCRMREDLKIFNISGMGCSAIDVVNNLFKTYKDSFAIVVSTESIGPNWYAGKDKSMMLPNCLFQSGGYSMLFMNRRSLRKQAILKMKYLIITHMGSRNEAYECCMRLEDESGYGGVRLTKHLKKEAALALTTNLQVLISKVLPLKKMLFYLVGSRLQKRNSTKNQKVEAVGVALNMKAGIEHFCIHPGGRAIIDGIGKSFSLSEYDLEPSRMALHRFGNTSSLGFWYALAYMEAKKRLKKGDRIHMSGFGSGFKCNNVVWEVLRDLDDSNVWKGCIDSYPPEKLNNVMEKFGWIFNESLSFVRVDWFQLFA
ncbi:hypothetical protein ACLB2K_076297 [Fragaria x ananassa]